MMSLYNLYSTSDIYTPQEIGAKSLKTTVKSQDRQSDSASPSSSSEAQEI